VWPDPFALPHDSLMQWVNLLILVCLIFPPFSLLSFFFWVEVALESVSTREVMLTSKQNYMDRTFSTQNVPAYAPYLEKKKKKPQNLILPVSL
jgi:hypothetical protein